MRDTIVSIDYNGNILSKVKIPPYSSYSPFLAIFSYNNKYIVADMGSDQTSASIFVYNIDLQCINNFLIDGPIDNIAVTEDGFYSICFRYDGIVSNTARNLTKYDFNGNIMWSKHFPDHLMGRVSCDDCGNIYYAAVELIYDKPGLTWKTQKISSNGDILWEKIWYGDYQIGTQYLGTWTNDVLAMPNGGGCITSGASTHPGQDTLSPNFNGNLVDPIAIAYNSDGEELWKLRNTENQHGGFEFTQWDTQNYLMIAGYSNSNEKLWKFSINGVTPVAEDAETPKIFLLSQNFPNPFNPSTTIKYSIPTEGFVSLMVYDILGNEVANLVEGNKNAGSYEVNFDAKNLSSGTYFYQLKAGEFAETKKLLLLK